MIYYQKKEYTMNTKEKKTHLVNFKTIDKFFKDMVTVW